MSIRKAARHGLAAGICLVLVLVCARSLFAAEHAAEAKSAPLQPIDVGQPLRIEAAPRSITLETPLRKTQVVVSGYYEDGRVQDLTRSAEFSFAQPDIARIDAAMVRPLANGRTGLIVRVGSLAERVPVEVSGQETPEKVSFRYGVLAALSKNHCNSGGCHGAPSGKGGFSLSMVAFDPESDKITLTRDFMNRRLQPLEPEASLLLRKPLMQVAHRGGLRLRREDEAYRLLLDWMRQGCQFDAAQSPECVGVSVEPAARRVLKWPAHTQQLRVTARFSDGSQRDITRLAMYASAEESLATVSPDGFVVGAGRGEVAISVRFLEHVETGYLTFVRDVPGFAWSAPAETNDVDKQVNAKLRQLQYPPSDTCTDEEFVRRAFVDVIGLLPAVEETKAFLADASTDKRTRLIDALIARPEFARFWALKWGDLLRVQAASVGENGTHKLHRWLVQAWESNLPYDQFAKSLLTAEGNTYENPPASYYRVTADTAEATEMTSQVFLGARVQCAKCHNHPFERWTQDNYYGLGAFFERVKRKKTSRPDEVVVFVARRGEITQPRTGKRMQPWAPGAGEMSLPPEADRLAAFAGWLTAANNPYFAKVEVNRIWAQLMGRGIVEPVDDFRDSNPPSNPELLDGLARDFASHGFDRKHVVRTILNSRAYQASSRPNTLNVDDQKYFSHARQQLLTAEQLLDAVSRVTGSLDRFGNLPLGAMATQLPAPPKGGPAEFLTAFGQPARQTSCGCERQSQPGLAQTLQLFNSQLVNFKLSSSKRIGELIQQQKTDDEIVAEVYLAALCRYPREAESQKVREYIASHDDRSATLQDIAWAVLNTREFLYRH